jgi:hypothetical protein
MDDVLAKAFIKLNQHHIKFAIESLAQNGVHEAVWGHGVESYYDPQGARKVAEKIKAAGGELVYGAMEPWMSHSFIDAITMVRMLASAPSRM